MTKADLVALSATYSAVITMDEDARRQHLEAMTRFLDAHEAFAGLDVIDVPMRSYCWRATQALTRSGATPTPCLCGRGTAPCAPSSTLPVSRRRSPPVNRHRFVS